MIYIIYYILCDVPRPLSISFPILIGLVTPNLRRIRPLSLAWWCGVEFERP